ncbi:cystathionine beta-lyase [Roseibium sp. SCP14]|uniref:cystathionine beta-lyase n=1 Tax=Roseibium sp. SCP14 TaxID=3141375 RepID=UPI003337E0E9
MYDKPNPSRLVAAAAQTSSARKDWRTRLVQSDCVVPKGFTSLTPAIQRGSTVVFESLSDALASKPPGDGYVYGTSGTPTTLELGARIAELEGARKCFVVPCGQAAIALTYLAYCGSGSHVLVPESVYRPSRKLGDDLLAGLGIEMELYDPLIGSGIANLFRQNTSLIWCESPGSITMEIQDVPAIAMAARAAGIKVALDNTYAAGLFFDAFSSGVEVSVQALTKYVGGHSDVLLGTVSVGSSAAAERIAQVHDRLGMAASPDDCALALRGLQTLAIRLAHLEHASMTVATWLKQQSDVAAVLHPAFPDCPGHKIWQRDYTGSSSVFSVVFGETWTVERIARFVDALRLFKIGFGWGGTTSLVMAYPQMKRRNRNDCHRLVRLNVGLEAVEDLIEDLGQAIKTSLSR